MWFTLIPVCDREIIVGPVIGVPMLDGRAQRFRKRNRRIEMEAIQRPSSARQFLAYNWRTKQSVGECVSPEIPRSQKIILRPGSVDRRRALAIDIKHVIALAPPAILIL